MGSGAECADTPRPFMGAARLGDVAESDQPGAITPKQRDGACGNEEIVPGGSKEENWRAIQLEQFGGSRREKQD